MSELTTGDILFGYQSPISQIYKDVEYKFREDMENKTMEAVHHFGISVDKPELIKALQYDRNQYDKGYSDGRASIVEELEKIKEEIHKRIKVQYDACFGDKGDVYCFHKAYEVSGIIVDNVFEDKISELKGEKNE